MFSQAFEGTFGTAFVIASLYDTTIHRRMRLVADAKPETTPDLHTWHLKQVC
jgi:hypothetical protein